MENQDSFHKQWFALYTASNNEKQVRRHLQRLEIESFLPLYTVTRRWQNRRTMKVDLPLFSNYVFARFARNESARVLDVPMVFSIVGGKSGSIALSDAEIDALRSTIDTGILEPHPQIEVGQLATIRTGPLAGWKGIVTRVDTGLRVVLTVHSIQKSFAVHVYAEDIELHELKPTN